VEAVPDGGDHGGERMIRALYRAHRAITIRKFEGQGLRWWHRAALAMVRWAIDRCEMWEMRHNFRRMRRKARALARVERAMRDAVREMNR